MGDRYAKLFVWSLLLGNSIKFSSNSFNHKENWFDLIGQTIYWSQVFIFVAIICKRVFIFSFSNVSFQLFPEKWLLNFHELITQPGTLWNQRYPSPSPRRCPLCISCPSAWRSRVSGPIAQHWIQNWHGNIGGDCHGKCNLVAKVGTTISTRKGNKK